MGKKDFESNVKLTGQKTHDILDQATGGKGTQKEADEAERNARMHGMNTQGRKGCAAKRINLAFTPDNHDFITFVSHYKGITLTRLVNDIIEQYRIEHEDAYQRAKSTAEEL